jgi:hypothetical protein
MPQEKGLPTICMGSSARQMRECSDTVCASFI